MAKIDPQEITEKNRELLAENTDLKIRIAELERRIEQLERIQPKKKGMQKCQKLTRQH